MNYTEWRGLDCQMSNAEWFGIACRFGGIESVKELLNQNIKFEDEKDYFFDGDHAVSLLNVSEQFLHGFYHLRDIELGLEFTDGSGKKFQILPTSERIEIYRLLKENAEKCCFDSGRIFYYAIMANDTEMISAMRENDEKLPEKIINMLTSRGSEWSEFCYTFEGMGEEEFFTIIDNISRELGGWKICFTSELLGCAAPFFRTPKGFDFILERFDQKRMNKRAMMKVFIDHNKTGHLEVAAKHGWLKIPQKRDEMIQYASDNGKTEVLAFLLDFKNRTADLAKERAAAEKRMLRELNVNPNSVTELKKSWGFVKNGDTTVVITSYKGNRIDVVVPEKIGKNTVTEIGVGAFSGLLLSNAVRLAKRCVPQDILEFRCTVTNITLPESVGEIGKYAFANCSALRGVIIPQNLRTIGDFAFLYCHEMEEISLPKSVSEIGISVFSDCPKLTVTVDKGSYAENYCKENQINFKYKENQQ